MAAAAAHLGSKAFDSLLTSDFVAQSIPQDSGIDDTVEQIKCRAGRLALNIFDPGKRDLVVREGSTFGALFPQDTYGSGFTIGLAMVIGNVLTLEEESDEGRSPAVQKFAQKVDETASQMLPRLATLFNQVSNQEPINPKEKLSDFRKTAGELDNFPKEYAQVQLPNEPLQELAPKGPFTCPLAVDSFSGHLVAKVNPELAQRLLSAYTPEIEKHLTEEGKEMLKLPFNIGSVVVVYKGELDKIPGGAETIIAAHPEVALSFQSAYMVPARGDVRYASIAGASAQSSDIEEIRVAAGLENRYSAASPIRFTFAAVHRSPDAVEDKVIVSRMEASKTLQPLMHMLDNAPIKV